MKKVRFLSAILVVSTLLLFVSICSASALDPKDTVIQAFQNMNTMKSYHMTLDVVASLSYQGQKLNVITRGESDVQTKPMLGKTVMNVSMDMGSKKMQQHVVQYIEEADKKFNIYSYVNNQWVRQSMPNYNPLTEYDNYFKGISAVTQTSEGENLATFKVMVNGSYVKENITQAMAAAGMQGLQLSEDFMQAAGDLTYYVTINKKDVTIASMEIDLSQFMSALGSAIADSGKIPYEQKQMMKDIFSNTTMTTRVVFSQFGKGVTITIPQEARYNSSNI